MSSYVKGTGIVLTNIVLKTNKEEEIKNKRIEDIIDEVCDALFYSNDYINDIPFDDFNDTDNSITLDVEFNVDFDGKYWKATYEDPSDFDVEVTDKCKNNIEKQLKGTKLPFGYYIYKFNVEDLNDFDIDDWGHDEEDDDPYDDWEYDEDDDTYDD